MSPSAGPGSPRRDTIGSPLVSARASEAIFKPGSSPARSDNSGVKAPSTNTTRRGATAANIPPAGFARALAAASGGPASGLASRISARRSVYFHSSMRRCGSPCTSKRRHAASRRAVTGPPASVPRSAAKASARLVSAAVLIGVMSAVMASGRLVLVLRIALGFEFQRQLPAAGAHDAPLRQNVHDVRHDVVEEPLVMGDDDHRPAGCAQPVDALGDEFEGIDVEAGIGFVEHCELGL